MKGKSSTSSALIPLKVVNPSDEDQPLFNVVGTELVVASATKPFASSSHFTLPDDWTVEKRRRRSSLDGRVDRYYYEPGTGRQFRSLRAIEKHLIETNEGVFTSRTGNQGIYGDLQRSRMEELQRSREMQIICRTSPFKLPDDWIVEEKPRTNVKYAGTVDRYYIEPGTGHRFRSLRAVERYLTQLEIYPTTPMALTSNQPSDSSSSYKEDTSDDDCSLRVLKNLIKAKKKAMAQQASKRATACHSTPSKATSSQKTNISEEKDDPPVLDSTSPPAKINWVLTGMGGNLWSPFMDDSIVPESVRQKWLETFILAVHD